MQGLYGALLWLYPADYRTTFGSEMMQVFVEASASAKKQRAFDLTLFTIRECLGLFRGALVERASKWTEQDRYITGLSAEPASTEGKDDVTEVRVRLEALIRCMEAAIAHHDFPKARFYSNEERITRLRLQRLIDDAELSKPILHSNNVRDLYKNA